MDLIKKNTKPTGEAKAITCKTVVPGSTITLFPSTNTSIFSGALATLVAVVRTMATCQARVGAPNDRARVSGVRIIVCVCGQKYLDLITILHLN